MRGASRAAWLLILAVAASAAYCEPVYVIDQLVVGVESTPGSEGERVAQVKSGDKLELLERQGEAAHVRLPGGKEGWIKASYVSTDEPLQQRFNTRGAELDRLKQDNDRLKQDIARLQSELNTPRTVHEPATVQAAPSAPIRETVFLRQPERPGQTSWTYLLGVSALMLLVGFVVGWRTLDRRIRQKYGGLRIY